MSSRDNWLALEAESLADTVAVLAEAAARLARQMALLQREIEDTAPRAAAIAGRTVSLRLIPGGKR